MLQHLVDLLGQLVLRASPLGVLRRGRHDTQAGHGDRAQVAQLEFRALQPDAVLESAAEGTRVNLPGESRGFFKLAEPLVVRLSKKYWETAAENLRVVMDDHPSE